MYNKINRAKTDITFHGAKIPAGWFYGLYHGNPFASSGEINIQSGEVFINRYICGEWRSNWEQNPLAKVLHRIRVEEESKKSAEYFRKYPPNPNYVSMSEVNQPSTSVVIC